MQLSMAKILKSTILKMNKDIETAQDILLKAINEVETTTDYQLAHLIYASLGGIYIYRALTDYALDVFVNVPYMEILCDYHFELPLVV